MGYSRDTFNPETYIKRGQSTKEMHLSCLCVLSEIIPKLRGYESFSLIRPPPTGPTEFLCIHPVGIVMMPSLKDTSADTFALLIDHDIQVLAKMTDKVVKRKIDKETNPQAHKGRQALQHLTPADYMAAGQTFESWMHLSRRNSVNVLVVCRMSKVPHPAKETVDEFLGMPTPMSTRATRERASPQLPKNVKMNGNVSGDGNVTIIEDCPYCGRPFGTGYVQVIITHGRFLR